jgi:hypothetical protein
VGKEIGNTRTVYKSSREGRRRGGSRVPLAAVKVPNKKLVGEVSILNLITERRAEIVAAEQDIRRNVRAARRAGVSWGPIGEALGVTRQSALERFGPYPVHADGRSVRGSAKNAFVSLPKVK